MSASKDVKRLEAIEQEAISNFLDKSDWDIFDWLNREDTIEYCRLYKLVNGTCPSCGDDKCTESCPYQARPKTQ